MGQNRLDHHQLFLEIDARDKPVFISADLENQRAGGRCVISGQERLFDCGKMRPNSAVRAIVTNRCKGLRERVFFGESRDNAVSGR
jgi:hypothetical protein